MVEKCSESFRIHLTEREMLDLSRLAHQEERTLSEFVRRVVLRQFLYGRVRNPPNGIKFSDSAFEGSAN